jgi:hypothetical protein
VYAYCTKGGTTADGASRWKYKILETEIEAMLDTNLASAATTASLYSVFGGADSDTGIHVDDFFVVVNPTTGVEVARAITAVNTSTNDLTLASAIGFDMKAKSVVKIRKSINRISTSGVATSAWSDEGVTYTSGSASVNGTIIAVHSTEDLSVGCVVSFGVDITEYRVRLLDAVTNELTCEKLDGTTTNVFVSAISSGAVVRSHFSPKAATGSEIGGSNIFIKWDTSTGTAETDYTRTFVPGDRIFVDCPGSSLEQDENSLQVAVDSTSIYDQDDKNEFSVDNRFLTQPLAKDLAARIIKFHSDAKFVLEITVPLLPDIDISRGNSLVAVDVVSAEQFPTSTNMTERFVINRIEHNTKSQETTLELLGIEPY